MIENGFRSVVVWGLLLAGQITPTHFDQVVSAHFAEWDLNHDGRIEGTEIDSLMNRQTIRGEAAAALAVLKIRERGTPAGERLNFAIAQEELGTLERTDGPSGVAAKGRAGHHKLSPEAHFQRNLKVLATTVPRLYAGNGPNFEAMKQGAIGDCYFFSVTGYLAAIDPKRIQQMIVPKPDYGFIVHFRDGETFPVPAPTEAELLVNNSASSLTDGLWLGVLEKALGERMRAHTKSAVKRTAEATDAMAAGGHLGLIIELYSGHRARSVALRHPRAATAIIADLRREIPLVLEKRMLIAVAMGTNPPEGQPKVPNLGYKHAYAILGFDRKTDLVTVWNPWGQNFVPKGPEGIEHGFAAQHGVFRIPLATLYHEFSRVFMETNEKFHVTGAPR